MLVFLLAFQPGAALAQGLRDEAAAKALAERAMAQIAGENIKGAIDLLRPHWPLPRAEIDVLLNKTLEQRKMVSARFGRSIGVQFIEHKQVAGTLLRITYIEKFDNHALRWLFRFYKPGAEWRLNAFYWDDQIGALLE
jgi:hypothetical protein